MECDGEGAFPERQPEQQRYFKSLPGVDSGGRRGDEDHDSIINIKQVRPVPTEPLLVHVHDGVGVGGTPAKAW